MDVQMPAPPSARLERVFTVKGHLPRGDQGALPPGHPVSWGAITAGTVLDAAEYPYPVPRR